MEGITIHAPTSLSWVSLVYATRLMTNTLSSARRSGISCLPVGMSDPAACIIHWILDTEPHCRMLLAASLESCPYPKRAVVPAEQMRGQVALLEHRLIRTSHDRECWRQRARMQKKPTGGWDGTPSSGPNEPRFFRFRQNKQQRLVRGTDDLRVGASRRTPTGA